MLHSTVRWRPLLLAAGLAANTLCCCQAGPAERPGRPRVVRGWMVAAIYDKGPYGEPKLTRVGEESPRRDWEPPRGTKAVAIELANAPGGAGCRRYDLAPGVKVDQLAAGPLASWHGDDHGKAEVRLTGAAGRPPAAVASLDGQGRITQLRLCRAIWRGVLLKAEPGWLTLRGRPHYADPAPLGVDYWWQPATFKRDPTQRVRLASGMQAALNLDPVPRKALRGLVGLAVEITPDWEGRARFVDAFRTNGYVNFTGGMDAYARDAAGQKRRSPSGQVGFRVRTMPYPEEERFAARGMRIYDPSRRPAATVDALGEHLGVVWVDPKSQEITHYFATYEGE